jgi:hypothetical protein
MTDYALVMTRFHAGREWALEGDNYDGLTILDDGDKPSKESLDDAWLDVKAEIEAELDAQAAARASALAKLSALGLTDAEITALVG